MNAASAQWSKGSVISGWAIALLYFVQSIMTIALPRTDKTLPLRETLRDWHILIGCILMALVIYRLWLWLRQERGMRTSAGVPVGLFAWGRALALAGWLLLLALPVLGFLFAWGGGTSVSVGPFFKVPVLLGESYRLWLFAGYFHSGAGFMILLLSAAGLLTATYGWLRYGKGLLAIFPPGFGALCFLYMVSTSWAMATFQSNEPGPASVARFLALTAVIWGLGAWLKRRRSVDRQETPQTPSALMRWTSGLLAIGLVALGSYGPYAAFRAVPWPMGVVVKGLDGATSHGAIVTRVTAWEPTEFDRTVAMETYKWCGFCHTFNKDGAFKVGPNLYGIFGQRVASVPNFHFSPALAQRRGAGMVWTDETLDAYLADPDGFVPGTTMIISSGPVSDERVRRAVINMLKHDTMPGAIDPVPAPEGQ